MRLKMRFDCTGEPPGELMTIATLGSFDIVKARSMAPAAVASERPGRSGVAMPIGPDRRKTGTTGRRLKNHIALFFGGRDVSGTPAAQSRGATPAQHLVHCRAFG